MSRIWLGLLIRSMRFRNPERTRRFPAASKQMLVGEITSVVADIFSTTGVSGPTYVEITPVDAVTFRMRPLTLSAMYRLPAASSARPAGAFSDADVAGPPSPE